MFFETTPQFQPSILTAIERKNINKNKYYLFFFKCIELIKEKNIDTNIIDFLIEVCKK